MPDIPSMMTIGSSENMLAGTLAANCERCKSFIWLQQISAILIVYVVAVHHCNPFITATHGRAASVIQCESGWSCAHVRLAGTSAMQA
jgi:hypothetical protein